MKIITNIIYAAVAVVILAVGAVTANGSPRGLYASINGTGENGGGFIYQYAPTGTWRIFASGLSRPRGLAFNRFGNLFVANTTFDDVTQTFQASIIKVTQGGVQSTVATLSGNFWAQGLAFDNSGNLFVMAEDISDPNLASTIYKFSPRGVQSTFGSLPGQAFGLAFDTAGYLFTSCCGDTIYKFAPDGTRSVFSTDSGVVDLTFDRFGNLFGSIEAGAVCNDPGDGVLKFTPDGVETTFATTGNFPRGLAFDRAGQSLCRRGRRGL